MSLHPKKTPCPAAAAPNPHDAATRLLPLGALAAGFGLLGAPAFAQTAPPAPAPASAASAPAAETTMKAIAVKAKVETDATSVRATTTTIGKGNQELRDIPQSVTVMTEKLLEDAKLTTLKEALHYTAGISFSATENGTDQDIRLRGFPIASTGDLLIDSMRDPSQYERDTFNLDRIEVMRGSASMLFGRGSTGGVVNQVTKKPQLVDETELIGTVGSRGYYRGTVDFSKRLTETAAVRVDAMVNKADNGGAKIDKSGIAPSIGWGLGTADQFNLGLFHLKVDNIPMSAIRWVSGTIPDVKPGNFYGTTADYLKGEANYVNGSWEHRFDETSSLRTQFRTGVFERAQWSSAAALCTTTPAANGNCATGTGATLAGINDATFVGRAGLTPRKDRYKGAYFQSDYNTSFTALGMKNEILTGIDLAHEAAARFQNNGFTNPLGTRPATTVGQPDDGAGLIGTANSPVYRQSSSYSANSYGVYAQDLIQVAPAWKVLAGIRRDNFGGNFDQSPINATTGAVTSAGASIRVGEWSYRGGVLFQPTPSMSFHFSYGTSFNTSADTYQYVTAQTANTPPEKSRNIELGAKLDWLDDSLSTRLAIFRTEKYNERTTDSDFAGDAYLLSGKRHSQGIELDVVGRITRAFEVYVSTSFIPTATIDQIGSLQANVVGSRVGLTPRWSGTAWLSYQATEKFRVAGGVRGVSENYALQGTSGAAQLTARAPGYAVFDAMVEYQVTPDVLAQVNLTNLTNKAYGDQLYPGFSIFGAPRTVQATVAYRF